MLKSMLSRRLLATVTLLLPGSLLLGRPAAGASQDQQEGPGSSGNKGGNGKSKGRNAASAQTPANPFFQPVGAPFSAEEQASYGRRKRAVRDTDLNSD